MTRMKKSKRKNLKKKKKLSTFKHGNAKMEWDTIREFSSSKEDIRSSERL